MASCIVKIGRSSPFGARPLNILSSPEAAPFNGNAFLPATALIPLKQHSGEAARPALLPGARVREGQVIAVPSRQGSAYVYASVPGILRGYFAARLPDGGEGNVALIELSGAFELSGRRPSPRSLAGVGPDTLLSMIEDYGLVRTFERSFTPLAFLMRAFKESLPDPDSAVVALRMYDFDPSCIADSFLAKNSTEAVLDGCAIVARALGARRIFLLHARKRGVPSNDAALGESLEGFEVKGIAACAVYPSGSEHICKREAARAFGCASLESVFCVSPWTALSVFNAIRLAMPVLQRPVLIAGAAIKSPQMLNVRIGTRIRDLVEQCGGFRFPPSRVIAGGLIAGKAVADLDAPVDMNTDALHFLGRGERRFYAAERCIHCGRCLRICPCRLDPSGLALAAQEMEADAAFAEGAETAAAASKCIFCGACSAVCPAGIPLHHIIKSAIGGGAAEGKGGEG